MARDDTFLGTGWGFPPRFMPGGADVEMVSGEADIHESLSVLFTTGLGERLMQDGFGCDMNSALFEEVNQRLVNRLTGLIEDAVLYHEPRISLDRVDVSESQDQSGRLDIRLDYTVRSTNSRFNMVFPFYINEANVPGARPR